VYEKIPRGRLDTPLRPIRQKTDLAEEEFVLDEIQLLVEKAGPEVIILVDACTIRHDVKEEVWDLIQRTGFPVYSTPMGKTAVPEDYERYGGVGYLCLLLLRLGTHAVIIDLRRLHFTSGNQGKGRKCETYHLCR
jgi:TPP-dependent 2-oxoacid decarboxylase